VFTVKDLEMMDKNITGDSLSDGVARTYIILNPFKLLFVILLFIPASICALFLVWYTTHLEKEILYITKGKWNVKKEGSG